MTLEQLSLLDTAGMKVREFYVTYHDRPPKRWFLKHLRPGFRHIELAKPIYYGPGISDVGWLLLLPTYEMLEVDICSDPRPPWLRCPDSTVQKVTALRPLGSVRSYFDVGPQTCVEFAKAALGINAFWLRTPWQLHQYIARRNGILRGN